MSSDITEIRHSISSDSSNSSSSAPQKVKATAIPPPPVKVKSVPVISKKNLAQKEEAPPDRRADLFAKINSYLTSEILAPHIAPGIKAPSENASLETLEAVYKQISESLRAYYKRTMVDLMFDEGVDTAESLMVNFLRLDGMLGVSGALKDSKPELFAQELEEIAIEMDSSMVPGPKVRLGLKLLRFFARWGKEHPGFSNQPVSPPQDDNAGE